MHYIPASQSDIHERLTNWRRYVMPRRALWFTQPMFRQARTPKQWEEDLHIPIPIDTQDGHVIEKAVSALPEKHRTVIRWYYIFSHVPENKIRRECGLTKLELAQIAIDARCMVQNTV